MDGEKTRQKEEAWEEKTAQQLEKVERGEGEKGGRKSTNKSKLGSTRL